MPFFLSPIQMALKKNCIAVQLGVLYDSQATNRKQGGLPVRALASCPHSYWLSAGMHKNTIGKSHKTTFFYRKL